MPVPIKISDNDSYIKVKPKSATDEITIKSDCNIDKKAVASK